MKPIILSFFLLFFTLMTNAQTPEEFASIWEKSHLTNKFPSNVRHADLVKYLNQLRGMGLNVKRVGESLDKREIFQVEWGIGKTRVLMWSQMHGDEPTATSAVIDMLAFLKQNETKIPWVKKLRESISLHVVPMLNPDGTDIYQRRNLMGIDINRDARDLRTPEAQLLMKLRNEFSPEIGFNLHNQQELTSVGNTTKQASISVLAVKANPDIPVSDGQLRNERIVSLMVKALNKFIPGNVGRYDDEYTESAFGDTFSDLGTPVILVESGGLSEKDENYLVKLNFVILLTALESIVSGREKLADPNIYRTLPENSGGRIYNYVFRSAFVVRYGAAPLDPKNPDDDPNYIDEPRKPTEEELRSPVIEKLDISVNRERRREEIKMPPTIIRRVSNLAGIRGLEEFDANGFYVLSSDGQVLPGGRGALLFYRATRNIDWGKPGIEKTLRPDAVFARGRFVSGGELIKKLK